MLGMFLNYHSLTRRFLRYPYDRRICVLMEPLASHHYYKDKSLARRYRYIFTHDKELLERSKPFVGLLKGTNWVEGVGLRESYEKIKLLSFIGAVHPGQKGGHGFRNKVVEKLLNNPKLDCFGKGIREIDSKITGLADYAFSIAMENRQQDYYFTEKINDCFLTDTVPIYWGCPSIDRFFDKRGILTFNTIDELLGIIDSLTMDLYYKMKPFVRQNKKKTIGNRWHSFKGIYERLGKVLVEDIEFKNAVHFRPLIVKNIEKIYHFIRK